MFRNVDPTVGLRSALTMRNIDMVLHSRYALMLRRTAFGSSTVNECAKLVEQGQVSKSLLQTLFPLVLHHHSLGQPSLTPLLQAGLMACNSCTPALPHLVPLDEDVLGGKMLNLSHFSQHPPNAR